VLLQQPSFGTGAIACHHQLPDLAHVAAHKRIQHDRACANPHPILIAGQLGQRTLEQQDSVIETVARRRRLVVGPKRLAKGIAINRVVAGTRQQG
jgi:hypothetical protein